MPLHIIPIIWQVWIPLWLNEVPTEVDAFYQQFDIPVATRQFQAVNALPYSRFTSHIDREQENVLRIGFVNISRLYCR